MARAVNQPAPVDLIPGKDPSLEVEHGFAAQGHATVIGIDEVGRGAIAGPVAVGVAMIHTHSSSFPLGLRDSKLLSEKRRETIEPLVAEWCLGYAVGTATAAEIDQHGITAMLGEAARRGLMALHEAGLPVTDSILLLDGDRDWVSPVLRSPLRVITRVKADRDCASVAAASVLAKVSRDREMRAAHAEAPHYGWDSNKGYGAQAQYRGIETHGLTQMHRHTWIKSGR